MKTARLFVLLVFLASALLNPLARAQETNRPALEVFTALVGRIITLVEPGAEVKPQTFTADLELSQSEGISKELTGKSLAVAFQAPDKARLSMTIDGNEYSLGRAGQNLWLYSPSKNFGINGLPGRAKYVTAPDKIDNSQLKPIKLPLPKEQLALFPLLFKVESKPSETVEGVVCDVITAVPQPQAIEALKIPKMELTLWVRRTDQLPARIAYSDGKSSKATVEVHHPSLGDAWSSDKWKLKAAAGDNVEEVALSHVSRFMDAAIASLGQTIPTLGPVTGERRLLASEGAGRLEEIDGTKVLLLKGTPGEMGRQHGVLMKKQVRNLVDRILYGVGIGSSFGKGKWFIGEIESAQKRLNPFMDERYYREMDAMAVAANLDKEEVRLANFFPELFHCSGFALYGDATEGGKMYHGRILDYLKGVGLEQNALVIVLQPDQGNAWVNISYAGFIGSVTAMNEKHIAIGEMGGKGQGNWDGKPMAELVREVMEKANTLDEAVDIMRKGPRTCEYYYVISDAKTKKAVGIAATATTFEVIMPGQGHEKLPHPFKDAVLMSAGDRYEKLSERVKDGYGKFTADSARDLMKRPVCMNSNIHSVLFEPESLDFWVANADGKNVASHTRFTKYNLADLIKSAPTIPAAAGGK